MSSSALRCGSRGQRDWRSSVVLHLQAGDLLLLARAQLFGLPELGGQLCLLLGNLPLLGDDGEPVVMFSRAWYPSAALLVPELIRLNSRTPTAVFSVGASVVITLGLSGPAHRKRQFSSKWLDKTERIDDEDDKFVILRASLVTIQVL